MFYCISWPWSIYLLVSGPVNYFFDLGSHFRGKPVFVCHTLFLCAMVSLDWEHDMKIDPGLHWLYMFEMGFYLHSLYATVYVETIRKDFVVLILHHILTVGLLFFSYVIRSVQLVLLQILHVQ